MDDEEEYLELLESACTNFEKLHENTEEEKWISILARRAVFIEEGNKKIIDTKAMRQRPLARLVNLEELKVRPIPLF
jgi:hypothetical protein